MLICERGPDTPWRVSSDPDGRRRPLVIVGLSRYRWVPIICVTLTHPCPHSLSGVEQNTLASVTISRPFLPWPHLQWAGSGGGFFARLKGGDPVLVLGLLLCAALVLRLMAMIASPLVPEEAYYWMYAQHPNLSYFDHPPMIAWIIGAGTWVFGNTEFGVRIVGNLLMFIASGLLYLFGRFWFGRSAGLRSAAMLHILPVYYGIGFVATMDSALLCFWMLGLGTGRLLDNARVYGHQRRSGRFPAHDPTPFAPACPIRPVARTGSGRPTL